MNIVNKRIPTLSGIGKADRFIKGNSIRISSFKEGIDCLIIGGKVTDRNGNEFRNPQFQEKFEYFSKKLEKISYVARGRIICKSSEPGDYNFEKMQGIFFFSVKMKEAYLDELEIELEAIALASGVEVPAKTSFIILNGVVSQIIKKSGKTHVKVQKSITLDARNKKMEDAFVLEESKKGKTILFVDFDTNRTVYVSPYEEIRATVEDVMMGMIKISFQGKTYRIANENTKQYNAIREIFYSKNIKEFNFKALVIGEKIETVRMI